MKLKLNCGLVITLWLGASLAWTDSLELKNGSLIKGKFIGVATTSAREQCANIATVCG